MSRGCYHDPSHACHPCRYYEGLISELREQLWQTTGRVARVLVEERDQHGLYLRVTQIRSIRGTDAGQIITVS